MICADRHCFGSGNSLQARGLIGHSAIFDKVNATLTCGFTGQRCDQTAGCGMQFSARRGIGYGAFSDGVRDNM